jgi:hypothetical protein
VKKISVFVNTGNQTTVTCPYCQKTYSVSVEKYKGLKHNLITRCSACQERFEVALNFRQYFRKSVKLAGEAVNLSTESAKRHPITIVDLSMIGLRFKNIVPNDFQKNHRLQITFTLDNQKAWQIKKEVRVVEITRDRYGCEFMNLDYEKELGFYLFSS